ncbi:MAG: helical backbone metal receptor [Planctomycetaceae bacterium]|jgi:iron complex transport system substrate-binding protein|nr:helical backbone metal receptor [Planctomycetaceae bacterium]
MKKNIFDFQFFLFICVVCLLVAHNGCGNSTSPKTSQTIPPQTIRRIESPQRLISTAPSLTELLFDIGLGDRVVGDSKFTTYPPETNKIEKIGGLYDGNWEKIVELKPDLVLILDKNESFRLRCQELGIESLAVDHGSMEGVLESYHLIGKRFGAEIMQKALDKKTELENKLQTLRAKSEELPPIRVLICIDRLRGNGQLQNLYVAGTNPYFQDAIHWAGGTNVAASTNLAIPVLSVEGVVAMNPEVIIDLMVGAKVQAAENGEEITENDLINDWKTLGNEVDAVKTGKIYVLTEDYATIPGPRTPLFVEKLLEILHGEKIKQNPENNNETTTTE